MVAKFCSRSHGQPLPGVRSVAMISSKRKISREGVIVHLAWRRLGFMPQDARPSQRNEPEGLRFPPIGGRHRPRKRTIQYSRASVTNREASAYWIPAFAEYDVLCRRKI